MEDFELVYNIGQKIHNKFKNSSYIIKEYKVNVSTNQIYAICKRIDIDDNNKYICIVQDDGTLGENIELYSEDKHGNSFNAKEAKEQSDLYWLESFEAIINKIKNAVENGKYCIYGNKNIDNETFSKLNNLGYCVSVKDLGDGWSYIVSWGDLDD